MSKEKISTREKIVARALELFNDQGIEYVGVRELAKDLDMKGGNITYYFPTKDDIILELASRLSEDNNRVIVKKEDITIQGFLNIFEQAYQNHYKYRSLFLSFPNLLKQTPALSEKYHQRQLLRRDTITHQLKSLIKSGHLRELSTVELDVLLKSIVMTSRFWISDAVIENSSGPDAIMKYVKQVAGLLLLVATAKGRKIIEGALK
jgi:AcrR family transcriptional regulator